MQYVKDWLVAWQTEVAKQAGAKTDEDAVLTASGTVTEMLARGGLRIKLSVDANLQKMLVESHKSAVRKGPSGGIVLNPRDGGVLAMSGGLDHDADPNNDATNASRPPGSTIKPFVLADAVRKGVSANSMFAAPKYITVDGPPIWDHTRKDAPGCKMTLADALAESNNVVFTEAITGQMANCEDRTTLAPIAGYSVTPDSVAELLHDAGADSSLVPGRDSPAPLNVEARLAIGGSIELSPLKLAVMGATLANGGMYHKPYIIAGVDGFNGENLFTHIDESRQVLDEKYARIVNQAMAGVFTHGTAVHDQVKDHPLAGKTGTTDTEESEEQRGDAWIMAANAVNPDYPGEPAMICVVWEGNNPKGAGAETGKACQKYFARALEGKASVDIPEADLDSGTKVGLEVAPPPPPQTVPPQPQPTTEAPPPPPTTEQTTEQPPPPPATTEPTRSTPSEEQPTGGANTGTVTVPGNPGGGTGNGQPAGEQADPVVMPAETKEIT
jgi:membrane peptidoglycan carboxypeptidase